MDDRITRFAKFIVFDIWGDFAHFRKFYTTSSPQTYDFPPRTAIAGIIGAIIGLKKSNIVGVEEEYLKYFRVDETAIAIHILKPIKKIRFNLNYIDTKRNWRLEKGSRTQVRAEFVRDPFYRIYFSSIYEDVHLQLKERLKGHKSFFTPSLGLSELLANFEFVGEYEASFKVTEKEIISNNVISIDNAQYLKPIAGEMYNRDILPNEMDLVRTVTKRKEFIFKTDWNESSKFHLKTINYFELENKENIILL